MTFYNLKPVSEFGNEGYHKYFLKFQNGLKAMETLKKVGLPNKK
jgi:hypothetical protein